MGRVLKERKKAKTHLDLGEPFLLSVAQERMRVRLAVDVESSPAQLLDGDEGLVDVRVLRDEVRPEVEREAFGVEHVRRGLGED